MYYSSLSVAYLQSIVVCYLITIQSGRRLSFSCSFRHFLSKQCLVLELKRHLETVAKKKMNETLKRRWWSCDEACLSTMGEWSWSMNNIKKGSRTLTSDLLSMLLCKQGFQIQTNFRFSIYLFISWDQQIEKKNWHQIEQQQIILSNKGAETWFYLANGNFNR